MNCEQTVKAESTKIPIESVQSKAKTICLSLSLDLCTLQVDLNHLKYAKNAKHKMSRKELTKGFKLINSEYFAE